MIRQSLQALLIAGVVLLAGCTGGISSTPASSTTGTSQTAPSTTAPTDSSTIAFYISDEKNAIGDFRHLNVTVTRVGFERAAADGGGWIEHEVDNVTVDLTELQGANATLIDKYKAPNGIYSTVFIHVSDVNATLQNGEHMRVKLPSEKLQLTKEFTVDNGSEVNFVFDITVHKAGNSGKYILKPVISESGTDVPIESTGDEEPREGLNLRFVSNVSQVKNATVEVTYKGEPVANATVLVNEEDVGTTDANGRITFDIPHDEKVKVKVKKDDDQAELNVEFQHEEKDDDQRTKNANEELNATFVGNVSQGQNTTLSVTRNGSAVANATVTVNDATVGTTGANGELAFEVPQAETLTVTVQVSDEEIEIEREFALDSS